MLFVCMQCWITTILLNDHSFSFLRFINALPFPYNQTHGPARNKNAPMAQLQSPWRCISLSLCHLNRKQYYLYY
uniref:Putative secreted protein n=1 Tax=Anopheles marajoara TaxID=58244 RepID=A0A2M4CDK5_9DIPT